MTVFAPTNEAFKQLDAEVAETLADDVEVLRSFLLNHVFPGVVMAETAQGNQEILSSRNNNKVSHLSFLNTLMHYLAHVGLKEN